MYLSPTDGAFELDLGEGQECGDEGRLHQCGSKLGYFRGAFVGIWKGRSFTGYGTRKESVAWGAS